MSRFAVYCRGLRLNVATKFLSRVFVPGFFSPVSLPGELQTSQNTKEII